MPHQRLLRKLDHYGVRGNTFDWIRAFLTHRTQQVTVEGATSDSVEVLSGVPQGTVLGPLLFLVFINDVPDCVQSKIRLFADDCILYRRIKNQNDCTILQDDLNSLAEWEKKWGMGKGWPLGSRLWCLLWVCHFPIGILGQVWYLIVSIPDLCNLTYYGIPPREVQRN